MRMPTSLRASTRVPLLQVAKTAIAMILAWVIAGTFLPTQLPIFAAIAALLVVQPSVNQSVGRAIERSIGVIVGVGIAYAIGIVFGTSSWIVLLTVVVAIFLSWALKLTPGTANQVPITAMLVLAIGAASPNYAFARIVETVIGAVIGVIVNIAIVPPVLIGPARTSVNALGNEAAATLDRLAAALTVPQTQAQLDELLITARLLRPMQAKTDAALTQARESLTLNPRQSRHRKDLDAVDEFFRRLGPVITRVLGMTRAFHDRYDDSISREPTVQAIADELTRASHDLRLLAREPDAPPSEPDAVTAGVPVLTAPLSVVAPNSRHWVLIGSLVEDLRRIHDEITGDDAP
ncbi:FUSC family protein [Diaminobutyricibacter sp. McL0618]|uniref:FUSC family protein n=1 Tax=Leifsonia sp. McL0618 TaxID=3415677 RepID=UPI003CE9E3ED